MLFRSGGLLAVAGALMQVLLRNPLADPYVLGLSGGAALVSLFLLGGAWGTTQAFVPGLEVSVAWKQLDFYVEAEYVRDSSERTDSYVYAWSELGFRPVEWLRVGIAGQRTRTYSNERDIQRGPFAQVTWGPVTIGGYWFNPGSSEQVFVGLIGVAF